jgi:hypothetical protein
MALRTAVLLLLAVFVGCYTSYNKTSYYKESLASQLPRDDGSILKVECISHQKHTILSVSPELHPQPHVTATMDDRTFVVYADKILLNGELYAPLASDVKKVCIEIEEDGFVVKADGQAVAKTLESR